MVGYGKRRDANGRVERLGGRYRRDGGTRGRKGKRVRVEVLIRGRERVLTGGGTGVLKWTIGVGVMFRSGVERKRGGLGYGGGGGRRVLVIRDVERIGEGGGTMRGKMS